MQINTYDAAEASGFYIVNFETFAQTLSETEVTDRWDLGVIAVIRGVRNGDTTWLVDNPIGAGSDRYPIWVEEGLRDNNGDLHIVDFDTLAATLDEMKVADCWDLGGIAISRGARRGRPVWLLENVNGKSVIWTEQESCD